MCLLIALLLQANCEPPQPRPTYEQLLAVYGPTPDCLNKDQHINYLNGLKNQPMRTGDTVTENKYNQAIDMYVERLTWYCEAQ